VNSEQTSSALPFPALLSSVAGLCSRSSCRRRIQRLGPASAFLSSESPLPCCGLR